MKQDLMKQDLMKQDLPEASRIDLLRRAWDKIRPSRYSDEKKRRLFLQIVSFVFLGDCSALPDKKGNPS